MGGLYTQLNTCKHKFGLFKRDIEHFPICTGRPWQLLMKTQLGQVKTSCQKHVHMSVYSKIFLILVLFWWWWRVLLQPVQTGCRGLVELLWLWGSYQMIHTIFTLIQPFNEPLFSARRYHYLLSGFSPENFSVVAHRQPGGRDGSYHQGMDGHSSLSVFTCTA